MIRRAALLLAVLVCAACSRPDNAAGAGGVSAGEAKALDDAAEMVQSQQLPASAIPAPQNTASAQPAPAPSPAQAPALAPAKPAG